MKFLTTLCTFCGRDITKFRGYISIHEVDKEGYIVKFKCKRCIEKPFRYKKKEKHDGI